MIRLDRFEGRSYGGAHTQGDPVHDHGRDVGSGPRGTCRRSCKRRRPGTDRGFRVPPSRVVSVRDFERMAPERMTRQAWEFISSGAGDENTVRWNEEAYVRLRLRQRALEDVSRSTPVFASWAASGLIRSSSLRLPITRWSTPMARSRRRAGRAPPGPP